MLFLSPHVHVDIFTFTPTDISGQDEEDDGDDDPVLQEGTCTWCTLILFVLI